MPSPQVTVLMAVFNGARTVSEAIDSVLLQTFSDWEMVIVDDCSTDNTLEIVHQYAAGDDRIKIVLNSENMGLPKSLNRGLKEANGRFVSRLDADDRFLPELLSQQVEVFKDRKELSVLAAAYRYIDESGKKEEERHPLCGSDALCLRLLFSCPIAHVGTMIRHSILDKVGGYSEDSAYRYTEDWELWTRIILIGEIDVLDEVLFEVRRGNTLTVTHNEKARLCAKNVMFCSVKSFMGQEELDLNALERFWRAYMFRDWGAANKGDVLLLTPLWRKITQQPKASTFCRRFFSVAVHFMLKLDILNSLYLSKVILYLALKRELR